MAISFGVGDRLVAIIALSILSYKLVSFSVFLVFFVALNAAWLWFQYREKQYWHNHGIAGPSANIFFGESLAFRSKGWVGFEKEAFAKYGKSFGAYMFDRREFFTMDKEILKRFFIKDFAKFQNRFNFVDNENKVLRKSLIRNIISLLKDDDWRRVRNTVTPAFTTGKLKKLIPTLCECTERLCLYMEKKYISEKKEIPIKDIFGRLVLDEIGRAGFSLDFDTFSDGDEENAFVQHTRGVFKPNKHTLLIVLFTFCPFLLYIMEKYFNYDTFKNSSHQFFHDMMSDLYEKRKADPEAKEKYSDIFQLLLNAVNEEEEEEAKNKIGGNGTVAEENKITGDFIAPEDANIIHKELWENKGAAAARKRHLSKIELFSQSFILLVAGFETTASVLQFAIYMITICPEVQERLREEVREVLGDEQKITYEHMKRMQYLQAVIYETMRMYPPAVSMNRECGEDTVIDGIPLRKGDIVAMPIYSIQHNEEFYPDPEKFDPERFLPEEKASRDPITFLTFGIGPRNCIGMRFAEFQMNVALAMLIQRFRFKPGPSTPKFPMELVSTDLLRPRPEQPILVLAEKT